MKTALITGGSSGFGLEFAKQLAAQKYKLILVARDLDQLENVAIDLTKQFGVKVAVLAGDLAEEKFVAKVTAKIRETKNLEILINNAGFGLHESLLDSGAAAIAKQKAAFAVMAQNILEFSAAAAGNMLAQKIDGDSKNNFAKDFHGQIINIASTSAWTYQGNYSAIKHWVVSYTEGLALELRETGITATAVCPAWMHTDFHKGAGLQEPSVPEWLFVRPEIAAKVGLRDARKGKILSVPTAKWKIIIWCLSHGPRGWGRWVSRKYMSSRNYQGK